MSQEYDNVKLISFYENNMKNVSKSPKRVKNGGGGVTNQSQTQENNKNRSPFMPRKENQENKSPSNKRGMYNFKRYTPEENGLLEVPVFITRDQMGNFLTPPSPSLQQTPKNEINKRTTATNETPAEQKIVWKLPIVNDEQPPLSQPKQQGNKNNNKNKGDKKNRKKDE